MLKNCVLLLTAWLVLGGMRGGPVPARGAGSFEDSPFVVDVWRAKEGLRQSSVFSIIQSRDGYLWLGTLDGLARFDGVRFTYFDEASTPGLTSSSIVHLFEDSRSNLWVGTQSDGVVEIQNNGRVRSFDFGHRTPLMSACEDASGSVWLNAADGELARYASNRLEVLNARPCNAVIAEKSGVVWLGGQTNLFGLTPVPNSSSFIVVSVPVQKLDLLLASHSGGYWRLADGRVEKWKDLRLVRDLGAYPWSASTPVSSACEDNEGNLIVGTRGEGVWWYDSSGHATQISGKEGLSHNTILSLCMDRERDLWVGTDGGGLNRVKRKQFRVLGKSLRLTIKSVCQDGEGGLWFANFGGQPPITHWKDGVFTQYDSGQGLLDPNVRSVFVDRDHQVWVGTTLGGLFALRGGTFQRLGGSQYGPISVMFQDSKGRLWFGAQGALLCHDGQTWTKYTTHNGLSGDSVRALAEDPEGNLWIGTERSGLDCFRNGKFTVIHKSQQGLPSDHVSALWADGDGVLWVGTSAGLARLADGKWKRYTRRDGLASNGIGYLIDDGEGSLWIGSYAGLMRVSKKSLNDFTEGTDSSLDCRVYGEADGLPTSECALGSQPAACQTRSDGRLWFATIQGLVTVDPAELKPNTYPAPVRIESVLLENREVSTNNLDSDRIRSVVVPPGKERLEIHYTSLNLSAADRSQFKYRLEGHETRWTDAGSSRVARYSNLTPGEYHFHVIACNEDGIWNQTGATLAVTVLPPFWQTWWFRGPSIAVLLGAIVGLVRYFSTQKLHRQLAGLRQREALEKERGRIARDLHDQLGANLTQVALLSEMAEADRDSPAEVESHARQITETARETTEALDEIVWAVNPANDTLDGLMTYACKYAQEYLELAGLRYRIEVPPSLPATPLAPEVRHNVFLAFKEAVNNVVKHAQASSAWIRLRLEPAVFILEIEDNGHGVGNLDGKSGRNGLRNMQRRMEDIGGSFAIGPAVEQGTVVRLAAPLRNH